MRTWICPRYGPPEVLQLVERPCPRPGKGEIVVRLAAASVSSGDARVRGCRFPSGMGLVGRAALGFRGPRQPVLGSDGAGIVEAVGAGVRQWREGDAVLVVTGVAMGCHAECVVVRADGVVVAKPEALSWAEAVSVPFGGQTARYFLDKAGLQAGEEILVIGASGAVGSAAVQLAALAGARVIAVTRAENADWIRGLGAEETIDYTATDYGPVTKQGLRICASFSSLPALEPSSNSWLCSTPFRLGSKEKPCASLANLFRDRPYVRQGRRYDVVMDCIGVGTFRAMRPLVRPGGAYLAVAGGVAELLARPVEGVRCVAGCAPESVRVVDELLQLAVAGKFQPVTGASFPFEGLPSAHALVDSGRKRGTAVVETGFTAR